MRQVLGVRRVVVSGLIARLCFDEFAEVVTESVNISEDGVYSGSSQMSSVSGQILSLQTTCKCVDISGGQTREQSVDVVEKIAELCSTALSSGRVKLQKVGCLLFGVTARLAGP